jgi:hypothetical protein
MTVSRHQTDAAPCSDALWEAVRYLSGELSPAEAEAYEARLEADLPAAESLARAVVLTESIASPRRAPSLLPRQSGRSRQALRWVGVVAAASCAGLLLTSGRDDANRLRVANPPSVEVAASPGADAAAASMLTVWVSLNDAREPLAEEPSAEAVEPLAETDVPDWMFAALTAPSPGGERLTEPLLPDLEHSDDLLLEEL